MEGSVLKKTPPEAHVGRGKEPLPSRAFEREEQVNTPVRIPDWRAVAVCAVAVLTMCSADVQAQTEAVPVVINELLASNNHNMPDPQGQYDDWICLLYTSPSPRD